MAELWSKLMVNCAYNAISGLAQASYGELAALPRSRELQHAVVAEVVARRRGRRRRSAARARRSRRWSGIAGAMPAQLSSTAQDMARGKPSEIDHLNGFVARRGRELGVATPANQALHALVKLVEAGHGARLRSAAQATPVDGPGARSPEALRELGPGRRRAARRRRR